MSKILFTLDEIVAACGGKVARDGAGFKGTVSEVITDSRKDCANALFIPLKGETFDGHDFIAAAIANGANIILSEPGKAPASLPMNVTVVEVADTTAAYQDLARCHRRRFPALKVVAVTGSSGKTSTKEMMRAVFAAAYGADSVLATEGNTNNQVGVPQNLLRLTERHRVAVLEMGTNHHGEIAPLSRMAEPDVAVITFIGNCHLEHLGSLEGVAQEKSMIFSCLKPGGTAVIPISGNAQAVLEEKTVALKKYHFGNDSCADVSSRYLGGHLHGSTVELRFNALDQVVRFDWSLSGAHQAVNAAAAAAAALALGVSPENIAAGLADCHLPGMRMRITRRDDGTTWINDAYNANPDSMASCLKWLAEFADRENLTLVLGDMLELGKYSHSAQRRVLELARELFPLAAIYAVGKEMATAATAMPPEMAATIIFCPTAADAASCLKSQITPGQTILLKGSRGIKLETIEQIL